MKNILVVTAMTFGIACFAQAAKAESKLDRVLNVLGQTIPVSADTVIGGPRAFISYYPLFSQRYAATYSRNWREVRRWRKRNWQSFAFGRATSFKRDLILPN